MIAKDFIFETERLVVRKLQMNDLEAFHEMQSNPKVMKYVFGNCKSKEEHLEELKHLIGLYTKEANDFWIYAIVLKEHKKFVGTCAFVKDDDGDDEIGYRFLEQYWGLGYGNEICKGMIAYAKSNGIKQLIAYVIDENKASLKILENCGFKAISKGIDKELNLPETKYQINL